MSAAVTASSKKVLISESPAWKQLKVSSRSSCSSRSGTESGLPACGVVVVADLLGGTACWLAGGSSIGGAVGWLDGFGGDLMANCGHGLMPCVQQHVTEINQSHLRDLLDDKERCESMIKYVFQIVFFPTPPGRLLRRCRGLFTVDISVLDPSCALQRI